MSKSISFDSNKGEFDEEFDNALIKLLNEVEKREKSGLYILNHQRVSEFAAAYKELKRMFGDRYSVTCSQRDGHGSRGWDMMVTGNDLLIDKPEEFVDSIAATADCFEVSSYLNGTVELAITFYGMVRKVGECCK